MIPVDKFTELTAGGAWTGRELYALVGAEPIDSGSCRWYRSHGSHWVMRGVEAIIRRDGAFVMKREAAALA